MTTNARDVLAFLSFGSLAEHDSYHKAATTARVLESARLPGTLMALPQEGVDEALERLIPGASLAHELGSGRALRDRVFGSKLQEAEEVQVAGLARIRGRRSGIEWRVPV
jgi:hypothetical protein